MLDELLARDNNMVMILSKANEAFGTPNKIEQCAELCAEAAPWLYTDDERETFRNAVRLRCGVVDE